MNTTATSMLSAGDAEDSALVQKLHDQNTTISTLKRNYETLARVNKTDKATIQALNDRHAKSVEAVEGLKMELEQSELKAKASAVAAQDLERISRENLAMKQQVSPPPPPPRWACPCFTPLNGPPLLGRGPAGRRGDGEEVDQGPLPEAGEPARAGGWAGRVQDQDFGRAAGGGDGEPGAEADALRNDRGRPGHEGAAERGAEGWGEHARARRAAHEAAGRCEGQAGRAHACGQEQPGAGAREPGRSSAALYTVRLPRPPRVYAAMPLPLV